MFLPQIIEKLDDYLCCYNHNKPIRSVCIESNYPSNKRLLCEECLNAINIEVHPISQIKQTIESELQISIQQCEIHINPFLNLLKQFEQKVCAFKDQILYEITSLTISTSQWMQNIEVFIKKQFNYSFFDTLEKLSKKIPIIIEPQFIINQIKEINNTWILILNEKMSKFLKLEQSKTALEILQNINRSQQNPNSFTQSDQLTSFNQNLVLQDTQNNFKFDQNLFSSQHPYCYAIAINQQKDIIVTSSTQHLRIFQITQGQFKLVQLHEGKYSKYITTLAFFKSVTQNKTFISGSQSSNIVIWMKNKVMQSQNVWDPQILLQGHSSCINCLIIDPFDSVVISGSDDKTIRFWYPQQSMLWMCQQTISEHQKSVFGLSINSKGNQLISCGRDQLILVMQNFTTQCWQIKQRIQTQNYGYRLSFINDNIFTFQPLLTNKSEIQIFCFDSKTENYIKSKDIQIQGDRSCYYYFPQVYISQKQILITKNGQYVNIIKFSFTSQDNFQDCNLVTALNYGTLSYGEIFGTISEDGEYLITWDLQSQSIQIKKSLVQQQTYNNLFRTFTYVSI